MYFVAENNMRSFIVITLLCVLPLQASILDVSLDRLVFGFREKFRQKCSHIGGENAFDELQLAASNLFDCVHINYNSTDTICTEQREKSYRCYRAFFEKLESCLEMQEKYLTSFFLNTHTTIFNKICATNNNRFLQQRGNVGSIVCSKPLDLIVQEYLQNCLPQLKIVQNLYKQNDVIIEEDVCRDILTLRYCDFINIKDYCNENTVIDLLDVIFESYLDTCAIDLSSGSATSTTVVLN